MSRERILAHMLIAVVIASLFAIPALTQGVPPAVDDGPHPRLNVQGLLELDHTEPRAVQTPGAPTGAPSSLTEQDRLERGLRLIKANQVHDRGITGKGVKVGVIGSNFDVRSDAVASKVRRQRTFGDEGPIRAASAHDTAVAEVVTQTAPDANLYLAGIGTRPTPTRYRRAVQWLIDHNVDIIVDSGSYFPSTDNGSDQITGAADLASKEGVVFVTSAGNYAQRHWSGVGDGSGWTTFGNNDTEVNALAGGNATSGRVSLRLYWNGSADYDLFLYRGDARDHSIVAKSVRRQTDGASNFESIDAVVPRGHYGVAVYAHHDTGNDTRLSLFSAYQSLSYTTATGSMVAPATGKQVISVGAIDAQHGVLRAYSSQGGENGASVDIDAPDGADTQAAGRFYGTSAAAPYVAGSIALMESRNGDLSPTQVQQILEHTAEKNGSVRRLDALAAVEAASATGESNGGNATSATNATDSNLSPKNESTGADSATRQPKSSPREENRTNGGTNTTGDLSNDAAKVAATRM